MAPPLLLGGRSGALLLSRLAGFLDQFLLVLLQANAVAQVFGGVSHVNSLDDCLDEARSIYRLAGEAGEDRLQRADIGRLDEVVIEAGGRGLPPVFVLSPAGERDEHG